MARTGVVGAYVGLFGLLLAAMGSWLQAPAGPAGPETWRQGVRLAAELDPFRTFLGGIFGSLGCTLALAGLVPVHRAVVPAGRPLAWVVSSGLALWLVELGAWHGIRPMLAHLHRVAELTLDARDYTTALTYLNVHRAFGGVGRCFGSVCVFFTVLFRDTVYPRAAAAAAPVLWVLGIRAVPVLPAGTAATVLFVYLDALFVPLFAATAWALRPADRTGLPPPSAARDPEPR